MSDVFKLVGRILIDNADAIAKISETNEKAKGLGDSIKGAGEEADKTSEKLGEGGKFGAATHWLGETLYKLTEKAVELGTNMAKLGFGFNMSMESYQYSFTALLGDADKAKQLIADIQLLAKETPLGLEKLANNAVSLITSGTELEDIIPTLEMLGNLSLGDPGRMNSVVRAYTQIISKGGLLAQEMYQLGDAMVPIREIMTEFGGEEYADGSWYERKMTDPTYKIAAEDMVAAFQAATAEGGKWHDYMYIIMDSFAGMADRLGEEGKETLGDFFKPFFDMAKSEVMPKLIESLATFRTWISENQEPLQKLADSVGNIVNVGFDAFLNMLQWVLDNGERTANIFKALATAIYLGAIAAHPYATAIATIVAGLAALTAHENKVKGGEILAKYSKEELDNLQAYVEAMRELKEAEKAAFGPDGGLEEAERLHAAEAAKKAAEAAVNRTKGLMDDYHSYLKMNGVGKGEDIWIDVPPKLAEGSEAAMQSELDALSLEAEAKVNGDYSAMYSEVSNLGLTAYANVIPYSTYGAKVDGSHADGLDRVPYDGYIAELHRDEAVLTASQAAAWRSGSTGGNTGRVESMLTQAIGVLQQIVNNTSASTQVVLDSGVLVGQLAPQMDAQLGTILNRKGRRN